MLLNSYTINTTGMNHSKTKVSYYSSAECYLTFSERKIAVVICHQRRNMSSMTQHIYFKYS